MKLFLANSSQSSALCDTQRNEIRKGVGVDLGIEGPEVKNVYSHQVMSALVATLSV